jgi:hypothetical protein
MLPHVIIHPSNLHAQCLLLQQTSISARPSPSPDFNYSARRAPCLPAARSPPALNQLPLWKGRSGAGFSQFSDECRVISNQVSHHTTILSLRRHSGSLRCEDSQNQARVSKEHVASTFRVQEQANPETVIKKLVCLFFGPKMEASSSSET